MMAWSDATIPPLNAAGRSHRRDGPRGHIRGARFGMLAHRFGIDWLFNFEKTWPRLRRQPPPQTAERRRRGLPQPTPSCQFGSPAAAVERRGGTRSEADGEPALAGRPLVHPGSSRDPKAVRSCRSIERIGRRSWSHRPVCRAPPHCCGFALEAVSAGHPVNSPCGRAVRRGALGEVSDIRPAQVELDFPCGEWMLQPIRPGVKSEVLSVWDQWGKRGLAEAPP